MGQRITLEGQKSPNPFFQKANLKANGLHQVLGVLSVETEVGRVDQLHILISVSNNGFCKYSVYLANLESKQFMRK